MRLLPLSRCLPSCLLLAAAALAGCGARSTLVGPAGEQGQEPEGPGPCAGEPWSRSVGGDGRAQAVSVAAGAAGRVLLLGVFSGTVDAGGTLLTAQGQVDYFLVSYDGCGDVEWARTLGSTTAIGGASGQAVLDPDGDVIFAGAVTGPLDLGGGPTPEGGGLDALVVKLDRTGDLVWAERWGDAADQRPRRAAVRDDGTFHVAGTFAGSLPGGLSAISSSDAFAMELSPDGDIPWTWQISLGPRTSLDSAGHDASGALHAGLSHDVIDAAGAPIPGNTDARLMRLASGEASSDDILYTFGGDGAVRVSGFVLTQDRNALALSYSGNLSFSMDSYSVEIDPPAGTGQRTTFEMESPAQKESSSSSLGGAGNQRVTHMLERPGGGYLITLVYDGALTGIDPDPPPDEGENGLLLQTDRLFLSQVSRVLGGPGSQTVESAALDAEGHLVCAGTFEQAIDAGSGPMTASGASDVWVARLANGL